MMKTIPRLLLVSFLLPAMVLAQKALADGCSSGRCPFTSVAQSAPPAPATASASRAFTVIGGSRAADVNLSPEGRERLAAGDKEEPLPKGFSTGADRAKLVAEQSPLYGWSGNEIPRRSQDRVNQSLLRSSIATRALRNSRGRVVSSAEKPVKPATGIKVTIAANAKSKN